MNTKLQLNEFNNTIKNYRKNMSYVDASQRSTSIVLKKLKLIDVRHKNSDNQSLAILNNESKDPQYSKFEQIENKWKFSSINSIK